MSIGIHVAKISHVLTGKLKKRKSMLDAIKIDCSELKINTCQIFVQGPRNSKMNQMEYSNIKKLCSDKKINLYVHSSYISISIFSVTHDNKHTPKSKKAIEAIIKQLEACDKLGSLGLVLHISKRTPTQITESLSILAPIIKKFLTPIILEMPAKKPDSNLTYETSHKINILTKLLNDKIPVLKWGWCIDTCHIWSSGIAIDKPVVVKKWLHDLKYPECIKLFHINGGSIDIFGTGKDKHIIPFSDSDNIFGSSITDGTYQKKTSIDIIFKFINNNNIDSIIEINRGSFKDAKFAIDTMKTLFN